MAPNLKTWRYKDLAGGTDLNDALKVTGNGVVHPFLQRNELSGDQRRQLVENLNLFGIVGGERSQILQILVEILHVVMKVRRQVGTARHAERPELIHESRATKARLADFIEHFFRVSRPVEHRFGLQRAAQREKERESENRDSRRSQLPTACAGI